MCYKGLRFACHFILSPPPSPVEATFLKVKGEEQEDTGTVVEAEGGGGEKTPQGKTETPKRATLEVEPNFLPVRVSIQLCLNPKLCMIIEHALIKRWASAFPFPFLLFFFFFAGRTDKPIVTYGYCTVPPEVGRRRGRRRGEERTGRSV